MDYLGYGYATIVAIGGSIGYFKAGSITSLIMGLSFGGLIGYAASRASNNPKDIHLALALSIVLLIVMFPRYLKSGKFMPAGLISALSFLMAGRYGYRLL